MISQKLRAVSSVVERLVYTERVGGSKPSPPILFQMLKTDAINKLAVSLLLALLLTSCASHHFRVINNSAAIRAAPSIEIPREQRVATLHFPAGSYYLYATDKVGYYYRAPRKIIEHTAAGSVFHDGGIYVRKTNPRRMRGYVFRAGALTHVGNLAAPRPELQDPAPPLPAEGY